MKMNNFNKNYNLKYTRWKYYKEKIAKAQSYGYENIDDLIRNEYPAKSLSQVGKMLEVTGSCIRVHVKRLNLQMNKQGGNNCKCKKKYNEYKQYTKRNEWKKEINCFFCNKPIKLLERYFLTSFYKRYHVDCVEKNEVQLGLVFVK